MRIAGRFAAPLNLYPPAFGATKADNGLAWEVLKQGDGRKPGLQSEVLVHYKGWRSKDGELFDSSYVRNEPGRFKVSQVIPGWTQCLIDMQVGESRRLWVPGDLGYGKDTGRLEMPPTGDLVYELELIKVDDVGDNIVQGFGVAAAALVVLTLLVTTFSQEPERAEYEVNRPFSIKVWGRD